MKKILIALALTGLVATSARADGYHGGHHGYHGGYHSGSYFWWGAAFGAALSIPFYYATTRSYADPYPYSYYNPGPYYYNPAPVVYVQNPPVYVQSQPAYTVAAAQPSTVVTQSPTNNGVIELGPVNSQPQANSSQAQPQGSHGGQGSGDQWFVIPEQGPEPATGRERPLRVQSLGNQRVRLRSGPARAPQSGNGPGRLWTRVERLPRRARLHRQVVFAENRFFSH